MTCPNCDSNNLHLYVDEDRNRWFTCYHCMNEWQDGYEDEWLDRVDYRASSHEDK